MKLAFRSGAFLVTLSILSLTSCGKNEQSSSAPGKSDSASTSAPATPAKESPASAPAVPQMKEPSAVAPGSSPATAAPGGASSSGEERDFYGTVGGQPVVASLVIGANVGGSSEVKGWYYPEARGSTSKLTLSGTLKDGVLSLDQISEGKVTATFELRSETPNGKIFMGNCMVLGRAVPTKLTAR